MYICVVWKNSLHKHTVVHLKVISNFHFVYDMNMNNIHHAFSHILFPLKSVKKKFYL